MSQHDRVSRPAGGALDRNLQVGSGGVNQTAPRVDFAARNLIVTNSVAGGRGFRGSVGYLAAGDFTGQTAGDSTQRFRADSAFSSVAFMSSPVFNDRFSVAQSMGVFEYRRDATPELRNPAAAAAEGRIRLDRAGSNLAFARQTEAATEPTAFATGLDRAQHRVEFTASGVQGMRARRLDDPIELSGLPLYERARARRDITDGQLSPDAARSEFKSAFTDPDDVRLDTKVTTSPNGAKVESQGTNSAYNEIVRKVVAQYADRDDVRIDADPRAVEAARKELADLRSALSGRPVPETKSRPVGVATEPKADTSDVARPAAKPTDDTTKPTERETPQARLERERSQRRETVAEAARALNHGTRVGDLAPGDRARVDELVRDGQRNLAEAEFFKAERAFDQALLINPDNPMLMAGLGHAQLGAGLYLSSALTIRTLFANHPEMIDVRFEPKLLPNETRLRLAANVLRSRLSGRDADGYGLALAYLGHQTGDRAIVEEGLRSLTGSMENDLLRDLLSQLWLGESTEPAPDATPAPGVEPVPPPK